MRFIESPQSVSLLHFATRSDISAARREEVFLSQTLSRLLFARGKRAVEAARHSTVDRQSFMAAARLLAAAALLACSAAAPASSAALLQGERDKAARAALGPEAARDKGKQLLAACGRDDAAAALRLIAEGANPDFVDVGGMSPLIHASRKEALDGVAARLIAAGAKLDLVNGIGRSALIYACFFRRAATALLLVEAGAALNKVDSNGKSALDWAEERGLAAVSAAIRARGGRTGAELKKAAKAPPTATSATATAPPRREPQQGDRDKAAGGRSAAEIDEPLSPERARAMGERLLHACEMRDVVTALRLIEAGAALDAISADGTVHAKTALDWADAHGLSDVAAALRARGAHTSNWFLLLRYVGVVLMFVSPVAFYAVHVRNRDEFDAVLAAPFLAVAVAGELYGLSLAGGSRSWLASVAEPMRGLLIAYGAPLLTVVLAAIVTLLFVRGKAVKGAAAEARAAVARAALDAADREQQLRAQAARDAEARDAAARAAAMRAEEALAVALGPRAPLVMRQASAQGGAPLPPAPVTAVDHEKAMALLHFQWPQECFVCLQPLLRGKRWRICSREDAEGAASCTRDACTLLLSAAARSGGTTSASAVCNCVGGDEVERLARPETSCLLDLDAVHALSIGSTAEAAAAAAVADAAAAAAAAARARADELARRQPPAAGGEPLARWPGVAAEARARAAREARAKPAAEAAANAAAEAAAKAAADAEAARAENFRPVSVADVQVVARASLQHAHEFPALWAETRCPDVECGALLIAPRALQARAPVRTCHGCARRCCTLCRKMLTASFHEGRTCAEAAVEAAAAAATAAARHANDARIALGERVQRLRLGIVERDLPLRCPRCKTPFVEFEGCLALVCGSCRCGFCALCLRDCGHDAHEHFYATHGDIHEIYNMGRYRDTHRAARTAAIAAAVRALAPDDALQRALVAELAKADLGDLGIAADDVLRAAGLAVGAPPAPPPPAPPPRPAAPAAGGARGIARDALGGLRGAALRGGELRRRIGELFREALADPRAPAAGALNARDQHAADDGAFARALQGAD